MLAGCSSALLSPRHRLRSEASVQLQTYQFQLQEKHCPAQQKMGTQRFDLPCGFSTRDVPRASLSLEKPPAEARATASCAFRHNQVTPSSSSSLVALRPRMLEIAEGGSGALWERRRNLKRERSSSEESQAKRSRTSEVGQLVVGGGRSGGDRDEVWFSRCTQESIFLGEREEEEKVFLVPNAACFPVLTSSTDTLVGSLGTDSDRGASEGPDDKSQSGSSSSSSAHSSSPELNRNCSENTSLNRGSGNPYPSSIATISVGGGGGEGESAQTEQQGLELVSLLTSCAESITLGNHEGVSFMLSRLGEMASPTRTAIHRVVAYFTEALAFRAVKLWPHIFSIAPPKLITDPAEEEDAIALRVFNYVSPIPKFIHFALNERLLRAFEGKDRVHIIDFDIKQGMQWPSLFQGLASRSNPPSHVRITGIGECRQDLQDAGLRLARVAEELKLPFEFHAVVDRIEDVRLWMLHVKRDECVAVNCVLVMHKALYDGSGGALVDLLGLIRSTNPAILLMAEQESKHNEAGWEARFANSLRYYAAIFDSLDYSLPMDKPARIKVEEMFAREIRNIVTCEGKERIERHESFDRWKKLMESGGFKSAGIGKREMLQSRMILRMYSGENYSIDKQGEEEEEEEEGDGITLKWLDKPLYTVSAWTPADIAGSSSTSQPS